MCHPAPGSELIAMRNRKVSTWPQLITKMQRKIVLNIKITALTLQGAGVRFCENIMYIDLFPESSRLPENN